MITNDNTAHAPTAAEREDLFRLAPGDRIAGEIRFLEEENAALRNQMKQLQQTIRKQEGLLDQKREEIKLYKAELYDYINALGELLPEV
jgi:hypothetical protein